MWMAPAKPANLFKEMLLQTTLRNFYWLLLSVAILAFDQLTKYLAVKYLVLYQPMPLMPSFNITLAHNTGAAFSLLGSAGGWQRWFFAGVALLASIVCVGWLYRLPAKQRFTASAISLILGGALGNLWDRLQYGYVIDFIDFYLQDWHWPVFNIADAAICIGVSLLIFTSFKPQEN